MNIENDILEHLMEDCQFIDIMTNDILTEGFHDILRKPVTAYHWKFGEIKDKEVYVTGGGWGIAGIKPNTARSQYQCLRMILIKILYGKLQNYSGNIDFEVLNSNRSTIVIPKSKKSLLMKKITIYGYNVITHSLVKYEPNKIYSLEFDTIKNLCDKYNVKYEIEEDSANSIDRRQILNKILSIFKSEAAIIMNKYKINGTIHESFSFSKDADDFSHGRINTVEIGTLHRFNAFDDICANKNINLDNSDNRDSIEKNIFNTIDNISKELCRNVNIKISQYNCSIHVDYGSVNWNYFELHYKN